MRSASNDGTAFVPPPYPYDRLDEVIALAGQHDGGAVDLSIGTPCDRRPDDVSSPRWPTGTGLPRLPAVDRLARPSAQAAARWIERRLGATVDAGVRGRGSASGTKEFVASLPQYLKLRDPSRDTVLYPAISYPTYEMGATLAGVAGPSPYLDTWPTSALDDATRALCLWVNSPGNPTGELHDLGAAADWGRVARRARRVGRVLRRVHLGRATDDDPAPAAPRACSPCTPCPSATTSPAPDRLLRRRSVSSSTTCARCASTPA